jgi:hypothetical protein
MVGSPSSFYSRRGAGDRDARQDEHRRVFGQLRGQPQASQPLPAADGGHADQAQRLAGGDRSAGARGRRLCGRRRQAGRAAGRIRTAHVQEHELRRLVWLAFSSPLKLAAGNYWIGLLTGAGAGVAGFRYDTVAGSRDYNANTYTSGPTNPFGSASVDGEQASLYATYSPE